jgi:hypothetical protein
MREALYKLLEILEERKNSTMECVAGVLVCVGRRITMER